MSKCIYCGRELSPKVLAIHAPQCLIDFKAKEKEKEDKEKLDKANKEKETNLVKEPIVKEPIKKQEVLIKNDKKVENKYTKKEKVLKK